MYKIAIMGKANTGKNTLSNMLWQEVYWNDNANYHATYGKDMPFAWKSIAFADPIKEIVLLMFPRASKENLYGPSHLRSEIIPGAFKNGKPLTYRQALIDLGTEVGRSYDDNIWLGNFDKRIKEMSDKNNLDLVIVTDVRFRNEFDHLKKLGYFQIRLYRDNGSVSEIQHISETGQSAIKDEEFDYVLFNNKPLSGLKEEVQNQLIPAIKSHLGFDPTILLSKEEVTKLSTRNQMAYALYHSMYDELKADEDYLNQLKEQK